MKISFVSILKLFQAKMFASHKIVEAEERARVRGRTVCESHGELYILYCLDRKRLVCIQCFQDRPQEERHSFVNIPTGHRNCVEKIEKWAMKLRAYQDERREELSVRQRILAESQQEYNSAKTSLFQICQQIIDTVMTTRDTLSREMDENREETERSCREQIERIQTIMDPIRLCLMSAQILCSSASNIDVLQLSGELIKRMQNIMTRSAEKLPASTKPIDTISHRSAIARALEPYLGLSAAWCPISGSNRDRSSKEGSGSNSYKGRSGSHPNGMPFVLSKFQTMIDLSGAFGQLFATVEETEIQLGLHSNSLSDMQPELQEIWQEQLDRVRRQQIIYREKVDECSSLRTTSNQVLIAARQLAPFASCIESMSALIDPKRCHPPDPAPMESICLQISTIEPDSESRILAIEKEEQNRRALQEKKKSEELAEHVPVTKSLKHGKSKKKDANRLLVNTNRERSPGGTDTALLSPCLTKKMQVPKSIFQRKIKFRSPSVKEETYFDMESEGICWEDSFEIQLEDQGQITDIQFLEEARCSSSLSLSLGCSSSCASPASQLSLPSIDQLLGRIPLASRVTQDVGSSRQSMMQSLQDMFFSAQQKDANEKISERPNVSASAVKNAQKKIKEGDDPKPLELLERKDHDKSSDSIELPPENIASMIEKKEVKRRRINRDEAIKTEKDLERSEKVAEVKDPDPTTPEPPSQPPIVPVIPTIVLNELEASSKLGSFEVKEKVLQSLKERMNSISASENED
ncbi:hypothetical protein WR25_19745 [Diploscapter pachys]|uniref:B box-type domain-containing protein n=1 Tax=Diploscapter pachys TaxID=2018661 RepID=A0A2A2LPJ6_9BILA|nr:hypothetical protein WR25_19745 [Diploscapter pachys]